MKKLALVLSMAFMTLSFTSNETITPINQTEIVSSYCDGWEDGYCEGWKDVKGSMSMCPMSPMCPMSEMFKDTYRDGYNRGFKAGRRKALNTR